ncbi:hypothetical protein Bca52824_027802 [Brassica carinata]|uniref:Uncharacterized protein n=1 Tax=Brassica carinata TaxID=52824 RepID=A0A8X7VB48_BRACI|nr:hypothetical protein Bca52824_027802 [Brassica carinata]
MSSDTAPPPELIGNLLLKALALLNLLSCLLLRFRCFLFKKSASDIWDIIMKVLPSGVFEYLFIVEVEAFPLGISNLHLGAEEYSIEPPLVPPDLQIKFVVSMFLSHAMGILVTLILQILL